MWQLSGAILYYQCRSQRTIVGMEQGCDQHSDTQLSTLVNVLGFVANHYYKEAKVLMGKDVTLPHTQDCPNQATVFPLTVTQALAW